MASSKQRENFVYVAKLFEQAKRYEEMLEAMKNLARLNVELTDEERDLLSAAFVNVVDPRKASWSILSSIKEEEETKGNDSIMNQIMECRKKVGSELVNICTDISAIIDQHLIPQSSGESNVFYHKMNCDYYPYLHELEFKSDQSGDDKTADQSLKLKSDRKDAVQMALPPDIIELVLISLPLKSLVRFRCVQKHWDSLILGPHVSLNHFKKSVPRCIIMLYHGHYKTMRPNSRMASASSVLYSDLIETELVGYRPVWHGISPDVITQSCCRGLILLTAKSIATGGCANMLWNPTIGQTFVLPPVRESVRDTSFYCLGYLESIEKFKVTRVFCKGRFRKNPAKVEVYTVGGASWRRIDFFPHYIRSTRIGLYYPGVQFLKNFCYWIAVVEEGVDHIISIDLNREICGPAISLPEIDHFTASLGVLRDSLIVMCRQPTTAQVLFLGEEGNWTQMFSFPVENVPMYDFCPLYMEDDQVLLNWWGDCDSDSDSDSEGEGKGKGKGKGKGEGEGGGWHWRGRKLIILDTRSGDIKIPNFAQCPPLSCCFPSVYVQSLISTI